MARKDSPPATITDLKLQIRALRKSVGEAFATKQAGDVKKLRRRIRHLKAATRRLARTKKAAEAAAAPAATA